MKLLFEKEGVNGSTELKELLGFIDADIKFSSIKPDVITATHEMIRVIGNPVYNMVHSGYIAGAEDQEELLYMMRYPIAIRSYSLLAPNKDISHTNNGRKMRQADHEKQAFEWMIDRDNAALERRFYRSMDDFLHYLDNHSAEWKASEAYVKSHRLFLRTTDDFNTYFPIHSRYVLIKLEPGIRQCEQDEILPRIGKDRFDVLKQKLQTDTAVTDEELQLLSLIQEACVYHALAWAMIRLSVHIFPEGVLQSYTSDRQTTQAKQASQKLEAQAARQAFMADAATVLKKIETLLTPTPIASDSTDSTIAGATEGSNYLGL
ncbi:MAG: hypothetical protein BM557_01325 [Flavobacterium sp. MedPE-SWcel]|uniref:DUF6712 family protein n=1 Tax=uncultured Flavobacterium sp. TaxID=165435 RepID=UPI0009182CCA|nr:DUF6712 family protein [uncultured Flavobacterium sp.]OIQ22047.1 MAG: hypothetical protein BM557_01325 [Flavobacterium sp. MedPE-SWcel]